MSNLLKHLLICGVICSATTQAAFASGEENYNALLQKCMAKQDDSDSIRLDESCNEYTGIFDKIFQDWPMIRLVKNLTGIFSKSNLLFLGTHKCWSEKSMGHACQVYGYFLGGAHEAHISLKNNDCCPDTIEGGTSVEFFVNGPQEQGEKARALFKSQPFITRR